MAVFVDLDDEPEPPQQTLQYHHNGLNPDWPSDPKSASHPQAELHHSLSHEPNPHDANSDAKLMEALGCYP